MMRIRKHQHEVRGCLASIGVSHGMFVVHFLGSLVRSRLVPTIILGLLRWHEQNHSTFVFVPKNGTSGIMRGIQMQNEGKKWLRGVIPVEPTH